MDAELAKAWGINQSRIRQEQLAKKGHSSQQRYDEARFDEQALLARVQQVDAEITAPFAAIVSERFADEGIVIGVGAPVFDLLQRVNPTERNRSFPQAVNGR